MSRLALPWPPSSKAGQPLTVEIFKNVDVALFHPRRRLVGMCQPKNEQAMALICQGCVRIPQSEKSPHGDCRWQNCASNAMLWIPFPTGSQSACDCRAVLPIQVLPMAALVWNERNSNCHPFPPIPFLTGAGYTVRVSLEWVGIKQVRTFAIYHVYCFGSSPGSGWT